MFEYHYQPWLTICLIDFTVDTEIPIIKHSSSPPALATHNQPQQLSHQNQQQAQQTQQNVVQQTIVSWMIVKNEILFKTNKIK